MLHIRFPTYIYYINIGCEYSTDCQIQGGHNPCFCFYKSILLLQFLGLEYTLPWLIYINKFGICTFQFWHNHASLQSLTTNMFSMHIIGFLLSIVITCLFCDDLIVRCVHWADCWLINQLKLLIHHIHIFLKIQIATASLCDMITHDNALTVSLWSIGRLLATHAKKWL